MALKRALQLKLDLKKRGGRRRGAGRPNRSGTQAHLVRPRITGREPMHVTLKLRDGLPSLRRQDIFQSLREAIQKARHQGLRLIHYTVLSNHVHMIVETQDSVSLTRAFQSLGVSLARRINKLAGTRGTIFKGRFHLHLLKSPRETRNALRYVLINEAKHRSSVVLTLDMFSSGALVERNSPLLRGMRVQGPPTSALESLQKALREICAAPSSWLLRSSWLRAH